MKKQNSRKKSLKYLLVLLLMISVGYAAIATTLKINGTATVKSSKWDVYWDGVSVTQGSVAATGENAAHITNETTKDEVAFSVDLDEPGDFYEFTVNAVNNGSIDAVIAENGVVKKVCTDAECENEITLPDYLEYTVVYAENDGTIAAGNTLAKKSGGTATTKAYKVRVAYRTDIDKATLNTSTNQTLYFRFNVNYVQG